MADDAGAAAAPVPAHTSVDHDTSAHQQNIDRMPHLDPQSRKSTLSKSGFDMYVSGTATPMTGMRSNHHEIQLDEYFVGPRDLNRHSKLPYFMRMHGSVLPRMILPIFWITCWATLITCISKFVYPLAVNTLLLTVLGFVVGLALSFRSTTAYERYSDGRKAWATLAVQTRNLARYFWVHIDEREGDLGKEDLLAKLTAINLLLAFAVSLKHKLRFEPYANYPDIASLISHLDTFAKDAYTPEAHVPKPQSWYKRTGQYLGVSFAASNPRKEIKRADKPLGNLPLEILTYISCYVEEVAGNQTLKSPVVLGQIFASINTLTDTMASAERVLTTPLPVGYNILISQIVLLYVYLLPFQLFGALQWITIPGTIAAAYIILGLAAIGNELENPFGNDVNDLPLDGYCEELRCELDVLTSRPPVRFGAVVGQRADGKVLWPLSTSGHAEWKQRSVSDIRSALKAKVLVGKGVEGRIGSSAGTTVTSKKEEP